MVEADKSGVPHDPDCRGKHCAGCGACIDPRDEVASCNACIAEYNNERSR
jgi:predicted nucleic acid-binding Zn ribbon protein